MPDDDGEMFVVEGTLKELQIARTTQNLLEQIETNVRAKGLAGGVGAAAGGMYGMVANAAAVVLYEGEDLHNFAAQCPVRCPHTPPPRQTRDFFVA